MSKRAHRASDIAAGSGAVISRCGRYRYRLWRRWADGPQALWIMLNPSTADAAKDDPTIRRCVAFATSWGCGGIVVANLYAWRATSPEDLWRAERNDGQNIVGPENDAVIAAALRDPATGTRIAAWGTHAKSDRVAEVWALVDDARVGLVCLSRSRSGAPRHPLWLGSDTPREPFTWSPRLPAKSRHGGN